MKKVICFIMMMLFFSFDSLAESKTIVLKGGQCEINGENITLSLEPFSYLSNIFLPTDDILPKIGFSLGWDKGRGALICLKDNNTYFIKPNSNVIQYGEKTKIFEMPSIIKNGVMCISAQMISYIGGYEIIGKTDNIYTNVEFFGDEKCNINTIPYVLNGKPFLYMSNLFVPIDDILPKLGYSMGWDDKLSAIICVKNGETSYIMMNKTNMWVGNKNYEFDLPPMINNGVTYISAAMFDKLTGCDITLSGEIKLYKKRDTLKNTYSTDLYRLSGNEIAYGGGVTAVDGFGMERIGISNQNALNYAAVINTAAEKIKNVNIYCIAVPTAAEFYAPQNMYPNQLNGMKVLYEALNDNVTPVNVYDTLKNHAFEKIYFGTDHHWTQRGAYYAYKEFIECTGEKIQPLETFQNIPAYNYVGSLAGFSKGTAVEKIMKSHPDILERFLPEYANVGNVYADQNMMKKSAEVKAVDTNIKSYSCFIGGDGPLTVFKTNVPNDKTIVIVKESFGNTFAVWAMNNYSTVYVVDSRKFNGFGGNDENLNLKELCDNVKCDDLVFINYPVAISSVGIRESILDMLK